MQTPAPARTEAADYYFKYIDQVEGGDICVTLERQLDETVTLFRSISDEQSLRRYAEDKWSIREVAGHINDCERLFVFRAFWFARGFDSLLPSFEQDIAATMSGAHERPWSSHIEEFRGVRLATVSFFQGLSDEAWTRKD